MARKRHQHGHVRPRGKRNPVWEAFWREDVIENGVVHRVQRKEILGTIKDYPTKKLALRELDSRHLSDINDLTYRPRPVTSFKQFAERWQRTALPNLKPSSQPPIRSQLKRHLIPVLGTGAMKDLTAELLQSFVTDCSKLSPKTTKNLDPVP